MLTSAKKIIKRSLLKLTACPVPLSLCSSDYYLPEAVRVLSPEDYQDGKVFCNINFDDLCPKYMDEYGLDFGGRVNEGLTVEFGNLLRDCPYIAVTHFVIPLCMIQKNGLHFSRHARDRYDISSPRHSEWLAHYKLLAETYNIEYALHGCYHRQFENILFSHHTEFAFKTEDESRDSIEMGLEIFRRADLESCGFRQPSWDINSDLSLCRALKSCDIRYIAGSSPDGGFNSGCVERVSNYFPTVISGLINFPQNIELDWEIGRIKLEIDRLYELRALISIKGHFVDKGMYNCLNSKNLDKLTKIANYIREKYKDSVEFITFADLAKKLVGSLNL